MSQQNPILEQQVKVKEKTKTMQKVVLGVGIFCALTALLNFAFVFNSGINQLAKQIADDALSKKSVIITNIDENRDSLVQLAINRELNNLQTFTTGQDNVIFLALDIHNNATETLEVNMIKFLAYVRGINLWPNYPVTLTPGYSDTDGGTYANHLANNLNLFEYVGGNFTQLNPASQSIIPSDDYHVIFSGISLNLPPRSTKTIVLKGAVRDCAPNGLEADFISFDLKNTRTDITIYDQNNNRVSVGPDNVNGNIKPVVYHQINVPNAILPAPINLQGYSLPGSIQNHLAWDPGFIYPGSTYFILEFKENTPTSTWAIANNGGEHIPNNFFTHWTTSGHSYQYRVKTCYEINHVCSAYSQIVAVTTGIVSPGMTFYAHPTYIFVGESAALTYYVGDATGPCTANSFPQNPSWIGQRITNPNAQFGASLYNLTESTNVSFTCPLTSGTVQMDADVTVIE